MYTKSVANSSGVYSEDLFLHHLFNTASREKCE